MNITAKVLEDERTTVEAVRVLVVEDERIVARSLLRQLTILGYEVVGSVPTGEAAIQQAGELRPDLVLMDINLEGPMDGVEAAATIRSHFRIPVVYLTAYSNKEILDRAKITEPFGYILKPYEERELHVVIETALYKHRMERRQQEREQWFAATLKSIGDAVVATDDEGRITYMNPSAERLTGWAIQDALGQSFQDALGQSLKDVVCLVDQATRQSAASPLAQAIQEGSPRAGILLMAKDRTKLAVETCVSIINDEQGESVGQVMVIHDVTWRKHLEKRIRQKTKMEAIGRLVGGMAHAFNNLMTVVLGHNEIMLDGLRPDDPFFANAQEIKMSATRTAVLTQRLLAFAGSQCLSMRLVDLNAVIGGLARIIGQMKGGVKLDLTLEPGLRQTRAEPNRLEEAILTIVRNACDAMPHGGRVSIQTANVELGQGYCHDHPEVRPGQYVLLSIADTGVGMDDEAISHLFEPFYTANAAVGAGLGLAAAYGFVKQCGGDIEVRSQPEKGTTFRVYLPGDQPKAKDGE